MASKVTYKLDLVTIFNRVYGDKPVSLQNQLRPMINDTRFKVSIGLAAIDKIEENTLAGRDKNGKRWSGPAAVYTKEYRESLAFRVYGKSASPVNLKLTGEMLASMRPVPMSKPQVKIEFIGINNDKAHGHINGYQNRNKSKARDFFGLPEDQEDKIMRDTMRDIKREELTPELGATLTSRVKGQRVILDIDEEEAA